MRRLRKNFYPFSQMPSNCHQKFAFGAKNVEITEKMINEVGFLQTFESHPPKIPFSKKFFNFINFPAKKIDEFENSVFYKKLKRRIKFSIYGILLLFLLKFLYKRYKEFKRVTEMLDENELTEKLSFYLKFAVLNFVFSNEQLFTDTMKLLDSFLKGKKVETFMQKQFQNLLNSDALLKNAKALTKEKLLLQTIFVDKQIEEKLKKLVVRTLAAESTKRESHALFLAFLKSDQAKQLFNQNMRNAMLNENVLRRCAQEARALVLKKIEENAVKSSEAMENKIFELMERINQ